MVRELRPSTDSSNYRMIPMNIEQIHRILNGIHHKIEEQKKIAAITGENFNVFKILGMETYEVQTHSAFLGELLNPEGAHGQGSLYLKIFLNQLAELDANKTLRTQLFDHFHADSAKLELEVHIGQIDADYTEGGRIDLVLTDSRGNHIFFENKIHAGDQKNQLFRYHRHDPKAALLYLTRFGEPPSKESMGNGDFEVLPISYQNHILQWLLLCRKESVMLPTVREALTQYIELIRNLTHQTAKKSMKEEIKKLIVKDPDYIEVIDACSQSLSEIIREAEKNFRAVIEKKLTEQLNPIQIGGGVTVSPYCAEDGDGFFVGYVLFAEKVNKSSTDQGKAYGALLHAIDPSFVKNATHIGWHNPVGFSRGLRVSGLNRKMLLKFYLRDKELDEFAQKIIDQQIKIRDALETQIKLTTSVGGNCR